MQGAVRRSADRRVQEEGYARASARAIATRAGGNAALVLYYFDTADGLLLAALARSSDVQLERYRETLAEVTTIEGLVAAVQDRVHDDMASGHVKVLVELVELVGAGSSDPALRAGVFDLVGPWREMLLGSFGPVDAPP